MKKYLVFAFFPFLLYACTVVGVWDDDNVRIEERETMDFSSSQVQKVEVRTKNGAIETRVWDDDSIHVVFEKWATGDHTEEAEDNLDDIKIHVRENTTSEVLDIDIQIPSRTGVHYGCNVYLDIPSSLFLDFQSSNGAITVLESQNGVKCSTSNGAITILDTEGHAELRTSNGMIKVRNHYGELDAETSNGAIDADLVLPRYGQCQLKTSNGAITLSIPDETSAMIEASTSNGRVEIRGLDVDVIRMEKKGFNGKMGRGEGDIGIETSNGNILVKQST
jgi:DUF4097 and DUF4098 domain-containing protein YvlB